MPIIYAIAGPNLLVALNKVQRDFYSFSVGAVQEGVEGCSYTGKVTVVIGDSSSTGQSNFPHPRIGPFTSGFCSNMQGSYI
jgi:hypothetical protein